MKLMSWFAKMLEEISNINLTPFWSDFWSNLLASLVVGIMLALVFPYYLDYLQRPRDLKFQFNSTNNDILKLTKTGENKLSYVFQLDLTHLRGSKSFNQPIIWHLYLPKTINPKIDQIPGSTLNYTSEVVDNAFILQGKIEGPIYANSVSKLFLNISGSFDVVPSTWNKKIPLYYYFSTEYGNYPRNFIKDNPNRNKATLNTMSKLYLIEE